MYQEVLRAMSGVGIYPVISLLTFVAVFGVAVFRAARLDAARLDECARLPLDSKERGGCQ